MTGGRTVTKRSGTAKGTAPAMVIRVGPGIETGAGIVTAIDTATDTIGVDCPIAVCPKGNAGSGG